MRLQLHETNPAAFSNFRLACKACNNASRYLLFHTVVINHCIDDKNAQIDELVEALKESNDTVRRHVTQLKIGPFEDADDIDPKLLSLLGYILSNINKLHILAWNMSCLPQPVILNLLKEKHPSARLHVKLRGCKIPEHEALVLAQEGRDLPMLCADAKSWKQLQRLDLQGYWPPNLFAFLTSCVPDLRYLKFYLPFGVGLTGPVIANFIASTPCLHTLDFAAEYIECLTEILRIIVQNLHGSLRSLTISHTTPDCSGPIDFRPGMLVWQPEQYLEILELTPGLEHFDAQIAGQTFLGEWEGEKAWAGAERKFKSAGKNGIKSPIKSKTSQRSTRARRLVR